MIALLCLTFFDLNNVIDIIVKISVLKVYKILF